MDVQINRLNIIELFTALPKEYDHLILTVYFYANGRGKTIMTATFFIKLLLVDTVEAD
jgi:hypothetical protein